MNSIERIKSEWVKVKGSEKGFDVWMNLPNVCLNNYAPYTYIKIMKFKGVVDEVIAVIKRTEK